MLITDQTRKACIWLIRAWVKRQSVYTVPWTHVTKQWMLEPHRTLSNNETSLEIQSFFFLIMFFESQFFFPLEVMVLNWKKQIPFNMWPAFHMTLLKLTLIFIAVSLHNQEPIKTQWFCYVCAVETGSRKELIQIMLLCKIRHISYHTSGVWRLKLHK